MVAWNGHLELTGLETLQVSLSPVNFLFCFVFFMCWRQSWVKLHDPQGQTASLPRNAGPHPLILPNSHSWRHGHHQHYLHSHDPATTATTSTRTSFSGSLVKNQRLLLPRETAPAVQKVVWNSSSKFPMPSQKSHLLERAEDAGPAAATAAAAAKPAAASVFPGDKIPEQAGYERYRVSLLCSLWHPLLFLPHGQERNNSCFICLLPLGCLAAVSWRPDTFHLALI